MPNFPSVIGLLAGQQKVQLIQGSTVVSIDVSVSEQHSRKATPTEFELENGETVSDHIVLKPFNLELNGVISDTPLSIVQAALTTAGGSIGSPLGLVGASVLGVALSAALSGSKKPSVQNFLALLRLQEQKLPVTVVTTLNAYENMFISDISVPRDYKRANSLEFKLSLVQLLLVSPQTVNVSIYAAPNLAAAESNMGQQGAQLVSDAKRGQALALKLPVIGINK